MIKKWSVGILILLLFGCASSSYIQPNLDINNKKTNIIINESKRVVWDRFLFEITKEYFVINNADYNSGLINFNYTNNKKGIDCGCYKLKYINPKFGNSWKWKCISILSNELIGQYYKGMWIRRNSCVINNRVNVLIQEIGKNKTVISFNIKNIIHSSMYLGDINGWGKHVYFNMEFNSGLRGYSNGVICKSTGFYENKILKIINLIK